MSNRLRIGLMILGAVLVLGLVGLFIFLRTRDVDPPMANGVLKTSGTPNVVEEVIELPPDQDGDGLKDETEAARGTDPANPDTDGDGATDFDEVTRLNTDPLKADAGINQRAPLPSAEPISEEDSTPTEPTPTPTLTPTPTPSPDPDGDGLTSLQEEQIGSDPNKADTDGDGFSDGEEVNAGYNPLGPGRR